MVKSMQLIKMAIRKYILRRKWRKCIFMFIKKIRACKKLQRAWRWKCRQKKVMVEIGKRIEKRKREAEEKLRREAEEKKRREEEDRRRK